ncbi:glycosyltransferase [Candidatus Parcubacteria bacterium]|nr:glycosyltransferase [Candidatus Parcubacteria bacterium]
MNFKATIIILDYMKALQTVANVDSLLAQKTDFNFKIIIIDNSCDKKNAEILSQLKKFNNVNVKINSENLGYSKAYNNVKGEIEGEYVLIVNPDILWKEKKSLARMINYMDKNRDIGILGPKQINPDGRASLTARFFPKFYLQVARRTFLGNLPILNKKIECGRMFCFDYDKIQDVDWLQSSCVVVQKKLWDKIRGFCEDYFLFMADTEICFQAWKSNYRVVYFPEVKVFADGKRLSAGGFKKFFKSWVLRQHVKDSLKYRAKHFFNKIRY